MAIIENFLLEELERVITNIPKNILSELVPLHKECHELKDLVKAEMPKLGSTGDPKIKESLYYLNNVMAEWHTLLEKHHLLTPETIHLVYNLRERLQQIRKDVEDAVKQKVGSVQGGRQPDLGMGCRWSSRSVDLEKIYGIEDNAIIMERLLAKEGFKAIGIVGMTGVGKTTLCQKAFNNQQVQKQFLPRIWVCLSKQPNDHVDHYKEELVKKIFMCLGFEDKIINKVGGQGSLDRLLFALEQQLKRHRYLIVLDDVWNMEEGFKKFCSSLSQDDKEQDRLGHGLPKTHGGTVVVTSRSPTMAESMVGEKNWHRLLPIADKESCWKIFKDAVEKDGIALTADMQKLEDEIVKQCAGLPLIAKMLGQISNDKKKIKEIHQSQNLQEANQHAA